MKVISSLKKYAKESQLVKLTAFGYRSGYGFGAVAGYRPAQLGSAVGQKLAHLKKRLTQKTSDRDKAKKRGESLASKPFKVAGGLVGATALAPLGVIATLGLGTLRGYSAAKQVWSKQTYGDQDKYERTKGKIHSIKRAITLINATLKGKQLTQEEEKDVQKGIFDFVEKGENSSSFNKFNLSAIESREMRDFLSKNMIFIDSEDSGKDDEHFRTLLKLIQRGKPKKAMRDLSNLMDSFCREILKPLAREEKPIYPDKSIFKKIRKMPLSFVKGIVPDTDRYLNLSIDLQKRQKTDFRAS